MDLIDDDFLALFSGYHKISGGGKGYKQDIKFLQERKGLIKKIIFACCVVSAKPTNLIFGGLNKNGEKAKQFDKDLAKFLPKLEVKEAVTAEEKMAKMVSDVKRSKWTAEFRAVNLSSCHRIALMSAEFIDSKVGPTEEYRNFIGGKPSETSGRGTGLTREIMMKKIASFNNSREFWNTKETKELLKNAVFK